MMVQISILDTVELPIWKPNLQSMYKIKLLMILKIIIKFLKLKTQYYINIIYNNKLILTNCVYHINMTCRDKVT